MYKWKNLSARELEQPLKGCTNYIFFVKIIKLLCNLLSKSGVYHSIKYPDPNAAAIGL